MTQCPSAYAAAPAYAAADAALAAKGRTFHWARRLLGRTHAERATRLYGFCRRVDDLADEAQDPAAARSALAALGHTLRTGVPHDPLTADTIRLMRDCRIDPAIPADLIQGVTGDLGQVRVADEAELLRYCYRVAGTVGLMMCAVLDVTDPRAWPHAVDLGVAMQLTNLCRDVRDDALAGRRYLPASLVGDLDPAQLAWPSDECRPVICHAVSTLLDLAERYYRSGEDGLCHLPPGARGGILVAARAYRAIGSRLRRRGCDYWSSRVVVTTAGKAAITIAALASAPFRPMLRPSRSHDPALHHALPVIMGAGLKTQALHAA